MAMSHDAGRREPRRYRRQDRALGIVPWKQRATRINESFCNSDRLKAALIATPGDRPDSLQAS
jgi:hypothetical protein